MPQATYSDLIELRGYRFPVYASGGAEERAQEIAVRCQQGHRFLTKALEFEVQARLLVLAPEHWQAYTGSPMFGVPQTIDAQTVVVAGQNSELWRMIVPPLESLPPAAAQSMRTVYGRQDGSADIAPYMDLLPVHEMAHLFVDQAAGQFDFHLPRRWLVELFCNLSLHAYVSMEEPGQIPPLEVFPRIVAGQDSRMFAHRSLRDFEVLYATMDPPNFVWYLSRLHVAAKDIFDAGGTESLLRLYKMIVQSRAMLPDNELAARLRSDVHPAVENVLSSWE